MTLQRLVIDKLKHCALAAPPPVTPKEKRRPFAAVRSWTAFTRSSTSACADIGCLLQLLSFCWSDWIKWRSMILFDSSLYQLLGGFVQVYVFSTFEFDAVSFIGFLTRILINGFFEFWIFKICSVLNFWEFKIEIYVEVDAIVVSIWILKHIGWTGLLRWFEDVSCSLILPPMFPWGSGLLEYWIRLYVRTVGLAVLSGLGCR